MTETTNPGPPRGAGGKNTDAFNTANNRGLSKDEVNRVVDSVGRRSSGSINLHDSEAVANENLIRAERNAAREVRREDPNYIEDVSDDESFLVDSPPLPFTPLPKPFPGNKITRAFSFLNTLTPNTAKRVVGALTGAAVTSTSTTIENQIQATPSSSSVAVASSSSTEPLTFKDSETHITQSGHAGTEIPRPILNLAKAKIHVPLTLLTLAALRKIHLDPSCVKMKKGLVLDDPKKSVMDTSTFPVETSLQADHYYEAYSNFLKMMALIADAATVKRFVEHRDFCLSRDEFTSDWSAVLNFDIEIRRKFFNEQSFRDPISYTQRWNEIKINTSLNANSAAQSGGGVSRYSPYPPRKPEGQSSGSASNDGKPFRKGKGSPPTDTTLCIICGRYGHRASNCSHTTTSKDTPVVSMWQSKLLLKSSSTPVCISFNLGRCFTTKHSADVLHVCSICGDSNHGAASKSCI